MMILAMDRARIARYLHHWWDAFRYGVRGGTFGWGVAVASGIVGFAQHAGYAPASERAPWWFSPSATVIAGLLVAGIFNAGFAFYRAWRMLKPFRVEVAAGKHQGIFPETAFPRQSATLNLRNLSFRQRTNCVLHVVHISDFNNEHKALPRFVCEFTLLPGEAQQIEFLYWFARSAPSDNDANLMVSGPVGWGWGGNIVQLPVGPQDIDLRIGIAEAVVVPCSVWVNGDRLHASARPYDGRT